MRWGQLRRVIVCDSVRERNRLYELESGRSHNAYRYLGPSVRGPIGAYTRAEVRATISREFKWHVLRVGHTRRNARDR